jgi:hypothetical protein
MPHPFASSCALIENAKKRTEDLIDLLIAMAPHVEEYVDLIVEHGRDAPLPYQYSGVEFIKDVPNDIRLATRDVLNDLRAALDHMAFACAVNPDAKSSQFPFAKTKANLEGVIKRNCRDIRPEIVEVMAAHRPYGDEDGDKLLYALNNVRNFNNHRLLQPMAQIAQVVKIDFESTFQVTPEMIEHPERWQNLLMTPNIFYPPMRVPEEKKVFFTRFDPRVTKVPEVQFGIYVGFGDVGHFDNLPPVHIFRQMIPMVEQIGASVARKCAEIEVFSHWRLRDTGRPYVNQIAEAIEKNRAEAEERARQREQPQD